VIVYGDPSFIASPAEIRAAFERFAAAKTVDAAREFLILCGQIEQAVADSGAGESQACRATDRAAEAFLVALSGASMPQAGPFTPDAPLRIKVPEGYAFYTLYPEQYLKAAEAWLHKNPDVRRVLVVGIRSIGTSLSAVVAAWLRRNQVEVERMTVRPKGHPFQREVQIPGAGKHDAAIVVDEGPGLSGSSIAAVVSALRRSGAGDVTIFPGHNEPPGSAASDEVRKLWAATPAIVFPSLVGLLDELRARTEPVLNSPVTGYHDLSAGKWRSLLPGTAHLPAVPQLERSKFLFRCANGRGLLWKFAGFGLGIGGWSLGEQAFHRQRRLGRMGWCQPPLAISLGFIATEWLDLNPANRTDCDSPRARAIARYILDASRPPGDASENFTRLREMTLCNLEEIFGLEARDRAVDLADQAINAGELPCYGDGRLAPHEWLISGERLVKTDVWGHDFDHTIVGEQSILWDIAGALLEWEMSSTVEAAFRQELQIAGLSWPEAALEFYKKAYVAFRLGTSKMLGLADVHEMPTGAC
jgi:hypothetical protein